MKKKSIEDISVDSVVYFILIVILVFTLYPFYYSVILSFNQGIDATKGGIFFWPRKITFENYIVVFSNGLLMRGFIVTISRTVVGTIAALLCTGLFSYCLTYKKLYFKKIYMIIVIAALYFSIGLIPYVLLLKNLKLMDNFSVYVIPYLMTPFNILLMISFFREMPETLKESARIDGANELFIFFRIILPLSKPIIATIALYVAVMQWNTWFDSVYFVFNKDLKTINFWLMDLINRVNFTESGQMDGGRSRLYASYSYTAQTIRMATMIITILPILCAYPFLQKYFVKGMMIGSVKE